MNKHHYIRPNLSTMDHILLNYNNVFVMLDNSRFPRLRSRNSKSRSTIKTFRGVGKDYLPHSTAIVEIKCSKCIVLAHLLHNDKSGVSYYDLDMFVVNTATRERTGGVLMAYEKTNTPSLLNALMRRIDLVLHKHNLIED